jgi:apolipoprotein N-acyltransferase
MGDLYQIVGSTPLLTGCLDADDVEFYNAARLYNAALLLRNGRIERSYRKQHLVPFGEYLPFVRYLPFDVPDPLGFDCIPGEGPEVMQLPIVAEGSTQQVAIAALICFEDAFSGLAADAVGAGAQILINITNDGWFERSGAARQHMAQSVLRAVEQGVPVVRCANSGVSCLVQRDGRVVREIADRDAAGRIRTYELEGVHPCKVAFYPPAVRTLYARVGDKALALPSAILVVGFLLVGYVESRKNGRRPSRIDGNVVACEDHE